MRSLIAVDIGNSNIKFAHFRGGRLLHRWRFPLGEADSGAAHVLSSTEHLPVAVASVVPGAVLQLRQLCKEQGRTLIEVGAATQTSLTGMAADMGADRVAEAVAARSLYARRRPVVVLGFGTASTLLAITRRGHVAGGWIAPGMQSTLEALHHRCALLPLIKMESQSRKLGWDTDSHMRNGVFLGQVGLARQWIDAARRALRSPTAPAVATGGWAQAIQAEEPLFDVVDDDLTLKGVYLLAQSRGCLRAAC